MKRALLILVLLLVGVLLAGERWRLDVGSQVAASIAVSTDNAEMLAVTRYDFIQLIDRGRSRSIAWRTKLDASQASTTSTRPGVAASHLGNVCTLLD